MNEKLSELEKNLIPFAFLIGIVRVVLLSFDPSEFALNCFKDTSHIYMGAIGLIAWQKAGLVRFVFWLLCVVEIACAVINRI